MNKEHNQYVYEVSIKEIEKLNNLTDEEMKNSNNLVRISQLKNNHILAIIKQQDLDYKNKDLSLRTTMYELRDQRNKVMKEHIALQEKKIDK